MRNIDEDPGVSEDIDYSPPPHHSWVIKWDAYAWRDAPASRRYKSTQHIRGGCVSNRCLFTYRVFAMFWLCVQWLGDLYHNCNGPIACIEYPYFTIWGQNMTTITYILLVVGTVFTKPVDPYDKSICMWWKVLSYMWTMVFLWDIIISTAFWAVMGPFFDWKDTFYGHAWGETDLMLDHIFPLFFCLVDWCLNGIFFEK